MSHQAAAGAEPGGDHGPDAGEIPALRPHFEPLHFPSKQVFGFLGSLVLTFLALLAAVHHVLPAAALVATVVALAAVQAGLQLGCFMHVREGAGPTWQIPLVSLAFLIAVGIVGFSVWIMAFKWGVS